MARATRCGLAGAVLLLTAGAATAEGAGSGLGDHLPVLGLAAALVVFAFTRKPAKGNPPGPAGSPAEPPAPAEVESPPSTASDAASTPAEEAAAEPPPGDTPPSEAEETGGSAAEASPSGSD
ncbi:hypothetical protein [Candidatus Methylocalor cossyra]|uniref:Uncharacterized protein n=1 Tax=Candidatus Methylocalor cossyra TaxID=3108543 RepID=A0ABM9NKP6_9GAMM